MARYKGLCMMCHNEREVRNISLYVIGSEGLTVCHECEMEIVEYIRGVMTERTRMRIAKFKAEKRKEKFKKIRRIRDGQDTIHKTVP